MRGCDRGRAEARLVTEDAAGDTLLHRDEDGAYHAAGDRTRVERRLDDGLDGARNLREVEAQDEQAEENVEDGHERHDVERNLRDALEPADDDAGSEARAEQARDGRGVRDGVAGEVDEFAGGDDCRDRRGNAVHLRDGADAEKARKHAEHREQHGEPLEVEPETFFDTRLDVVEGAAQYLAVSIDLAVLDREQAPSVSTLRYLTASRPSEYFVAMPKKAATSIQKSAPGPPVPMAVATPTMLPVPTVAASAVQSAAKLETSPSPSFSLLVM